MRLNTKARTAAAMFGLGGAGAAAAAADWGPSRATGSGNSAAPCSMLVLPLKLGDKFRHSCD